MKILAIDFGTTRIGLAVADTEIAIAHPLESFVCKSRRADFAYLKGIIIGRDINTIVVGLPLHSQSGEETSQTAAVRAWAGRLGDFLRSNALGKVSIEFADESRTTQAAKANLRHTGLSSKQQKDTGVLDAAAAAVILEGWLLRHQR